MFTHRLQAFLVISGALLHFYPEFQQYRGLHAFISSCLNYCSALFVCLDQREHASSVVRVLKFPWSGSRLSLWTFDFMRDPICPGWRLKVTELLPSRLWLQLSQHPAVVTENFKALENTNELTWRSDLFCQTIPSSRMNCTLKKMTEVCLKQYFWTPTWVKAELL